MAVAMIGPKFYAWDRNGKPLAFGKLYTYEARTNIPKPTYQSEDQVVENTNPVILNGEGYANVYLSGSYKMVLKDKDENEIWSSDPVSSNIAEEWINCATASYLSPTSFKLVGNFTDSYTKGRKVRLDSNATEFDYSTIESSSYAAGETTVTVVDSVVKTGLVQTCASVVSPTSSFNSEDLIKLTDCVFASVDDMVSGVTIGNITIEHNLGNQYSTGGTNWKVESSGLILLDVGLYANPLNDISVKDFGAIGNGALDDTAAIQRVIDLVANTNYPVKIPNGEYVISSPLNVTTEGMVIKGESRKGTVLKNTSNQPCLSVDGGSSYIFFFSLTDLTIEGDWDETAHTGTTGYGLFLNKVGNGSQINNCEFLKNSYGIWMQDSYTFNIYNVRCQWNGNFGFWSQSGSNAICHYGCQYNFNGTSGARAGGLSQSFYNCNIEGNEENGVVFNGRGHHIFGGYFEKPTGEPFAFLLVDSCIGWGITGAYVNDLGGSVLPGGNKYLGVYVTNSSSEGIVDKSTIFINSTGDVEAVRIDSGSNNIAYLEEDELFNNTASATNVNISTARIVNERGFTATVSNGSVINHNSDATPNRITLTPLSASPFVATVTDRDETTFTVGVFDMAGAPIVGSRDIFWTVSY